MNDFANLSWADGLAERFAERNANLPSLIEATGLLREDLDDLRRDETTWRFLESLHLPRVPRQRWAAAIAAASPAAARSRSWVQVVPLPTEHVLMLPNDRSLQRQLVLFAPMARADERQLLRPVALQLDRRGRCIGMRFWLPRRCEFDADLACAPVSCSGLCQARTRIDPKWGDTLWCECL